jgi:predicted nucleotidyltransferase
VRATEFDELTFFRAIHESGVRAVLIGRQALVMIGIPVITNDYDFWIAIDEIAAFNAAVGRCDLHPSVEPDGARGRGRYVLENDERVDVLVARAMTTIDGTRVDFEDVWARRKTMPVAPGVDVHVPDVDDLILTKRFGDRPKDLEDIRLLRIYKSESGSG